ncbi:Protein phosphatase 1 regulatory subunit 21 [Eumeta japonica]|uniref:Protein phosphatase 1 regulatory subunit 21 n=1 Tax=Eumeta variegata TaxID=151549 RepID=A0A4C1YE30_EUMVA|nr:Protein phosphatase 1 regulatory subunit 21 [Eumeta japonica]
MEKDLLQMENESLKLEVAKHTSASQKRTKSEGHDSGDFNQWGVASADGEGHLVGLLGILTTPMAFAEEQQSREQRLQQYFRKKLSELALEKELLESKTEHYVTECEGLRARLELAEDERAAAARALVLKHDTIGRLVSHRVAPAALHRLRTCQPCVW